MQLPSEKLTHWTMIVAAVSSVGLNMWEKKQNYPELQCLSFFMIYMGKMINHKLRGSLLSEKPLFFLG